MNEAEAEKYEEQLRGVQKKIQAMESQFDVCTEDLFNQAGCSIVLRLKVVAADSQAGGDGEEGRQR